MILSTVPSEKVALQRQLDNASRAMARIRTSNRVYVIIKDAPTYTDGLWAANLEHGEMKKAVTDMLEGEIKRLMARLAELHQENQEPPCQPESA